jgi:hypothetical protein
VNGWRDSMPKLLRGARARRARALGAAVRHPVASITIGASKVPAVVWTTPSPAEITRARRNSAPVRAKRSRQSAR